MQKPRPKRKVVPVHMKESQWHKIVSAAIQCDQAVSEYIRNAAVEKADSQVAPVAAA